MAPDVRVCVCGPLIAWRGGTRIDGAAFGSRKARQLLGLLACREPAFVTAEAITAALWPEPDELPTRPEAVVASLVSRVRAVLGAEAVAGTRDGYRLDARTDLRTAAELIGESERRAAAGQPALALSAANQVIGLLTVGAVVPDAGDAAWVRAPRDRVITLLRQARHVAAATGVAVGEVGRAIAAASDALAADPFDETATRLIMAAHLARGESAPALEAYDRLRRRLRADLGVDPAPETRALHQAALTERVGPARPGPVRLRTAAEPAADGQRFRLVGRASQLAAVHRAWDAAASGRPSVVLLLGEAGSGKTRLGEELASLARRTGGTVLAARCYDAEQSRFAQPIVDAVVRAAGVLPPIRLRTAVTDPATIVRLAPQLALALQAEPSGSAPLDPGTATAALAEVVCRLSADAPTLLWLDDLQHASRSTLEVLHHVARRVDAGRLLVLAGVRDDGSSAVATTLAPVSTPVLLTTLSHADVRELAGQRGLAARSEEIVARTGGNPLYVVETVYALDKGESSIPATLQSAILDRVARAGPEVERTLRAAAVLGAAFDPLLVGALLGVASGAAVAACEGAYAAHLLTTADARYEFSHDVVREVLLASTPSPTRIALHRRAADLRSDDPEAVAGHAEQIGDRPRAARALLRAAEAAVARFAASDAIALASRTIALATELADPELAGRALLARARALDATAQYAEAMADLEACRRHARAVGDRRLQMAALRDLAGDVPVALGRPPSDCVAPLQECLALAEGLGDRLVSADVLDRLTVLAAGRLDFVGALALAQRAYDAASAARDPDARVFGLDAVKTAHAYLGDVATLADVIGELEPMLRRSGSLWLLQWAVFESSFVPLAAQDYGEALARIDEAIDICGRSGYVASEPFFTAHRGWVLRLCGDLDAAVETGRRAVRVAERYRHTWWSTTAATMLAASLAEAGDPPAARTVLRPAVQRAEVPGAEAYLLRCLGTLAAVTGSREVIDRAETLLHGATLPAGRAWLTGADAYLGLAGALLAHGECARAAAVLDPFRSAAAASGWPALVAAVDAVRG